MADIAQLVRALVCGTKCRRFESGYPPHYKTSQSGRFFNFWRFGREPQVRNVSWRERALAKFKPYVVKGAHGEKRPWEYTVRLSAPL